MKSKLLLFLLIFSFETIFAQEDAWVYFKDKPSKETFLSNPSTMLTERSLERRTRYNIPLDEFDVPVEANYISTITNANGITVKAKSKWLNAVHVQGAKTAIENLLTIQFEGNTIVSSIEFADKTIGVISGKSSIINQENKSEDKLKVTTDFNYGRAANQTQMIKVDVLHQNNFTGEGMVIAVLDAGFPNVNTFSAFNYIRTNTGNSQILGGYNYVGRSEEFYTGSTHGTSVLSTIAGYVYSDDGDATNDFIGTAPDAQFYLYITEDSANEVPLEESLWVEAAEEADRLGVDVITTSLGYSSFFDESRYNYSYSAMDGKTTFITRGAEIAFTRGMILINSAGNEGTDPWHYMNAPADGPSVLSIGAVNASGVIASFSSYGPTYDGRVKPDVCAQGSSVYIINSLGNIGTSNGTSFSGPLMAGAVACLWQAFPQKTNAEITQMVRESAHLFNNPTAQEGYGIPNFETIYNTLSVDEVIENTNEFKIYPNPTKGEVYFSQSIDLENADVRVFSTLGKLMYSTVISSSKPTVDLSFLPKGLYFIQLKQNLQVFTQKIIKE
ncbi:S8 family serine peptidase [Lutibacter sp.]|uniref:S8 family serine peptidase n=1 Tax=Lutibacter sp. TaxID=1925666 RepID=UPI00356206E6